MDTNETILLIASVILLLVSFIILLIIAGMKTGRLQEAMPGMFAVIFPVIPV